MSTPITNPKSDLIPLVMFVLSLVLISVLFGMFAWKNNWFPATLVREALGQWNSGAASVFKRPQTAAIRHRRAPGAHTLEPDSVAPGLTLVTSYWEDDDWYAGARLLDISGAVLHQWNVRPKELFEQRAESPVFDSVYIHGSYLFPDGRLLFNLEYVGLAMVDACNQLLWKSDVLTHHSISRDEHGQFWVAGYRRIERDSERRARFPGLKAPFGEDMIYSFSEAGVLLGKLSLLEAIYDSPYRQLLWSVGKAAKGGDLLHLNDVEVLSSEMLQHFPMFEAGDIMISSNYLSMVAVLSPTGQIKWASHNQFYRQHDPNFETSGLISVYDNRPESTLHGTLLGGSRIVTIDPANNQLSTLYPKDNDHDFFSSTGGKHQLLDNGNRLLTELQGGRVFEIDSQGNIVWEWLQKPLNDKRVAEVSEGHRYNLDLEQIAAWTCSPAPIARPGLAH